MQANISDNWPFVGLVIAFCAVLLLRPSEVDAQNSIQVPPPCVPAWNGFIGADDLPSTILSSIRGHDGFVYLGGRDGLYRLDGGGVRSWLPNFSDTSALPAGRVSSLARDGSYLWVGTAAGLVRMDPKTEEFQRVTIGSNNKSRLSVTALEHIGRFLWIGTTDGVFLMETGSTNLVAKAVPFDNSIDGTIDHFIQFDGQILAAGEVGLFHLQKTGSFNQLDGDVAEFAIRDLALDSSGQLWLSTSDALYRTFSLDESQWVRHDRQNTTGFPDGDFVSLTFDRQDRLWLGSMHGLSRWDLSQPNPLPCRRAVKGSDRDQDLSIAHVSGDLGDFMFLGTQGRGAAYAPLDNAVRRIIPGESFSGGLPSNSIWSTALDRQGRLYVGTGQGLFMEQGFRTVKFSSVAERLLGARRIYAIAPVNDDTIWIGTDQGAYRMRGGSVTAVPLVAKSDELAARPSVYSIKRYQDKLLFGTGDGLVVFNKQENRPQTLFRTNKDRQLFEDGVLVELPGNRVWSIDIFEDKVFAAGDNGAWQLDIEENKIISATGDAAQTEKFVAGRIYAVLATGDGEVMLGTEAGLVRTNEGFSEFEAVSEINGLRLKSVMSAGRSVDGALWIGVAGTGLFRRKLESDQWAHISQSEGLITSGVSQLGLHMSDGGEVIVSNATGASILPASLMHDNRPLDFGLHARELLRSLVLTDGKSLEIGPDERDLRLRFSVPALLEPDRYNVAYTFTDGEDIASEKIIPLGQDLTFPRLAPGSYGFSGRLLSTSGQSTDTLRFSIEVLPFWWERQITYFLAGILLLGLTIFLFVRRTRAIEARYSLVADERKRIAQDLHDTFLQDVFGARMIGRTLEQDEASPAVKDKTARILGLLQTATASVRQSVDQLSTDSDTPPLAQAIRESRPVARYGDTVEINVQETGHTWNMSEQRRFFLARITQEAVNNACKHARTNSISVSLKWSRSRLLIEIVDFGKGFDPNSLLNNPGFGLAAMERMAAAARSKFLLKSNAETGTHISVSVPRFFL